MLKELVLAVPPPVPAAKGQLAPISAAQFSELERFIDGFSLMTYDHNGYGTPGPNAPLPWVQANLKQLKPSRSAVLTGRFSLLTRYRHKADHPCRSPPRQWSAESKPYSTADMPINDGSALHWTRRVNFSPASPATPTISEQQLHCYTLYVLLMHQFLGPTLPSA